jgi:hypothetical protein
MVKITLITRSRLARIMPPTRRIKARVEIPPGSLGSFDPLGSAGEVRLAVVVAEGN